MVARKSTQESKVGDLPPTAESEVVRETFLGRFDIMDGMSCAAEDIVTGEGVLHADQEGDSWTQQSPMNVATPKARDGYVQEWIRIADVNGKPDVSNKEDAFRNRGWRPRSADTISDTDASPVYEAPGFDGGVIVWKGQLLLCEMQKDRHDMLTRRLSRQADAVNAVIYNEASKNNDLPSKYASIEIEGSNAADLMD